MLKKKCIAYAAICLISLLILPGCSKRDESGALTKISVKTIQESTPTQIREDITINGKTLVIDAPVELGNISTVSEIKLVFSEDKLNEAVEKLIYSKYPNAIRDSSDPFVTCWVSTAEATHSVFFSADKAGQVSYIDRNRDLECNLCEVEHLLEDEFITGLTPTNMSLSTQEACEVAADFLADYSCFTFSPWNVLAANNDNYNASGYYYISMEAAFDGIPICHKFNPGEIGINAYALLSNEGIFQFEGLLLLEPVEIKPIEQIVQLDDIIGRIKENFSSVFSGELVEIDKISLEYMPEQIDDSSFCLRPAWCFSCIDTRTESDTAGKGIEHKLNWEYVFYADDGSFCGLL